MNKEFTWLPRATLKSEAPQKDRLALIYGLASRGAWKAGCDGWRAQEMCRQIVGLLEASGDVASGAWKPTHRHRETGREFVLIGHGQLHLRGSINDGDPVAIYEDRTGQHFVRLGSEFYDGRFEGIEGAGVEK